MSHSNQLLPIFSLTSFSQRRHDRTRLLTHLALPYLLCRHPKNRDNLHHYPNDGIHHFRRRRNICVGLETSQKTFNRFKDPEECILASPIVLSRL